MHRLLILTGTCFALAACGGKSEETTVNRDTVIEQLLTNVRGTVGAGGTPCVAKYLRNRSDDELDKLLNDVGSIDDGDRAFTAAVIACAPGS